MTKPKYLRLESLVPSKEDLAVYPTAAAEYSGVLAGTAQHHVAHATQPWVLTLRSPLANEGYSSSEVRIKS